MLHAYSFVYTTLCIINFKSELLKWPLPPVIVLKNAQHADELRRLRVWLNWFRSNEKNHDALSDEALDF